MRGFESAFISTATDWAWAQAQVPYDCPYPIDPEGRYTLRELIAIGPRSWVYIAYDSKLSTPTFDARVIVKIGRDPGGREAELGRQIEHPDVPAVLDRGVSSLGHMYVVLEWIDGQGLDKIPVPWERHRAVRFIARLGRIIESAHARGIVHCDLKPDNVRVGKGERPILIDFDLAAQSHQGVAEPSRGNLGFMSPEQFRGDPSAISPQADVYGLGGLLVYLLTGQPVNGTDAASAQANLASARTWSGQLRDAGLRATVARAVEPATSRRYRSVSQFVEDLERWEQHVPIEWQRPSPSKQAALWVRRKPGRAAVILAAGAVAASGTVGAFAWQRAKAETEAELIRLQARYETQRLESEADALRKANELALAKIEELKVAGRAQMRSFLFGALTKRPGGQGEQYLPVLNWLSMASQYQLFAIGDKPLAIDERLGALEQMRTRAIELGQIDSVPQLLTRLAIAELQLRAERPQSAAEEIAGLRHLWEAKLSPGDPLLAVMDAIELTARTQLGEAVSEEQIAASKAALLQADAPTTYLRLLESTAKSAR